MVLYWFGVGKCIPFGAFANDEGNVTMHDGIQSYGSLGVFRKSFSFFSFVFLFTSTSLFVGWIWLVFRTTFAFSFFFFLCLAWRWKGH